MKKWELTLKRAVAGTSSQTYSVMAENEDDAVKLFEEAFESNQENLLRDGEEEVTVDSWGPIGKGKIAGTEIEVEIEF